VKAAFLKKLRAEDIERGDTGAASELAELTEFGI
jgi:hypothetical protein